MAEFRRSGPSGPRQHIARLEALITELEELRRGATGVPSSLLTETRASLERARRVLTQCESSTARAVSEEDGDGDAQPDVDRDLLDRMFRHLKARRRPPER